MCFIKKKKEEVSLLEDRETILLLSQEIDVLIAMTKNQELIDKLVEVQDQIKYCSPYKNEKVYNIDLKIKQKVEDIKLLLIKNDETNDEIVLKEIDMINIMIKERNAKEIR